MPNSKIEEAEIVPPVTTIAEYTQTAAALATFNEKYKGVIYDVATTAGMKSAIEGRAELRTTRVALEKKRKEIKEPALTRCKQIDSEAARITAEIEVLEKAIDLQIKTEENRKEKEKAEKEAAEVTRKANIQELIARIRAIPSLPMPDSDSISVCMAQTDSLVIDPQVFMEFSDEAELAKTVALNSLNSLLNAAQEREKEQKRIEADRAELEELRAKQADMQRQLDEANALEQKRLDDEKANMERINGHKEGIANIKSWAGECVGVSSDRVARFILDSRMAESLIGSGVYEEFEQEAETARVETLEKMEVIKAAAEKGEKIERERYEEEITRQREAEEKQKELDRISEEERFAREKKTNEEKAAAELKAKEAEKARKISEKAKMLAEAKCKDAATAFKKILDICKDEDLSDKEARNMAALLSEANI